MNVKKIAVFVFIVSVLVQPALHVQANDDDLTLIALGGTRVAFQGAPIPIAFKRILTEMNLINPDFIVHTGDLVFGYGDSDDQLQIEYSTIGNLLSGMVPEIFFVPGNYDFQTPITTKHFKELTGQKEDYFSFDREGVSFIILNTELPGQVGDITGEQRSWLEKELEMKKDSRAIFVFMNRPLFSFLIPNADKKGNLTESMYNFVSEKARLSLIDLLTKYKVTAVLAGHEHLYYRTDHQGVPFITLGGGGATFSAPPDKGGFFNYMIISVKGKETSFNLMEPYHFSIETSTYKKDGKTYGEVLVHNIHGELFDGIIHLRGIKLTLPKGEYTIKGESVVPVHQIVKVLEAIGTLKKHGSLIENVEQKEVQSLIEKNIKPQIYKIEPNEKDNSMVDVWIDFEAPGTVSVRLTVIPKS